MVAQVEIHLVQKAFLVGDIESNTRKILAEIEKAREAGADVVVFPELAVTGYPPEDLLLRHDFIRQAESAVTRIITAAQGIEVIFGAPHQIGRQLFNAAFWAKNGELRGVYNKFILPNYAVFDEKRYFEAGTQPSVFDINGISFGLSVCEDIWYTDPAAVTKSAGAQALFILNASPYHCGKYAERLAMLHQRYAETGLALFYLNIVGGQDELVFDGQSMVLDGQGELAGRGHDFKEEVLKYRLFSDGRVEALNQPALAPVSTDDASIYQALVTGVRDYVNNNGFAGVVIGLSGGVDSALTLAIAVDALGPEKVLAVMMPSRYTADISQLDAEAEARALGVEYKVIPIEPAFNTFLDLLKPAFNGMAPDTTEENIQARCRGILLMALSNKLHRMVLTTGNKSEMAVGYCTLYGDMAGGFAPLKDVFKMRVYSLSRYRNSLSPVIPERVLTRPPSAELKADQTDQDSLPPYEVLDAILSMTVEHDKSHEDIVAAGYDAETVARVKRMVQVNEYKRRQAPPGVRITRRAFGRDRRYPITSGYRRK